MRTSTFLAPVLFGLAGLAFAQQATFQTKSLTPETALTAARAAMEACRTQGYQVGVAVVDRAGLTQVFLRDRFAGPHTVEVATNKAWTAVSFRTSTLALGNATLPFLLALADKGWKKACADDKHLLAGLNTHAGKLTYAAVGVALGLPTISAADALKI